MTRPKLKKYDWKITARKALRPALTVAVSTFIAAMALDIDAEALISLGVPAVLAPSLVEAINNWAKNRD